MSILVDSNIWIYANIKEYPEHEIAVEKVKSVEKKGIVINDIIFSEVYHKLAILLKSKAEAKIRAAGILDSSYVFFSPVEKQTLKGALEISVSKDLRINDSIIGQHCIENNWELLTDNIRDFSRVQGIRVIPLHKTQ